MNQYLEAKLRGLPLRSPAPAWKEGILDAAVANIDKKRAWVFFIAAIPAWLGTLQFRYRMGLGALAATWMWTLFFCVATPSEKSLQIAQFSMPVDVSAEEMFAAIAWRNCLLARWSDRFEFYRMEETEAEEVLPHYRL